jgi:tRNA uridine 5-carbamoylmethylation protein Kti12
VKRLVVITVGKTHSGKTTFAKELEQYLHNSVVIDRDDQAEFINTYYKTLLPKQGANILKNAISRTIVDCISIAFGGEIRYPAACFGEDFIVTQLNAIFNY